MTTFLAKRENCSCIPSSRPCSRPVVLLKFPVRLIAINFLVATPFRHQFRKTGSDDNQNFKSRSISFLPVTTFMRISNFPIYILSETNEIAISDRNLGNRIVRS